MPGLYVIDSIVRQSRHQFGTKDSFGPRFTKNFEKTFLHLFQCPEEDKVSALSLSVSLSRPPIHSLYYLSLIYTHLLTHTHSLSHTPINSLCNYISPLYIYIYTRTLTLSHTHTRTHTTAAKDGQSPQSMAEKRSLPFRSDPTSPCSSCLLFRPRLPSQETKTLGTTSRQGSVWRRSPRRQATPPISGGR